MLHQCLCVGKTTILQIRELVFISVVSSPLLYFVCFKSMNIIIILHTVVTCFLQSMHFFFSFCGYDVDMF